MMLREGKLTQADNWMISFASEMQEVLEAEPENPKVLQVGCNGCQSFRIFQTIRRTS